MGIEFGSWDFLPDDRAVLFSFSFYLEVSDISSGSFESINLCARTASRGITENGSKFFLIFAEVSDFSEAVSGISDEIVKRASGSVIVRDIFNVDDLAEVLSALSGDGESFREVSSDEGDTILEEEESHFALEVLPSFIGVEADKNFLTFIAIVSAGIEELGFIFSGEFTRDGGPSLASEGEDIEHAFADGEIVVLDVMSREFDDLSEFFIEDLIILNGSWFDGIDTEDAFIEDVGEVWIIEFEVGIFRAIFFGGVIRVAHISTGGVAREVIAVEERYHESVSIRGEA